MSDNNDPKQKPKYYHGSIGRVILERDIVKGSLLHKASGQAINSWEDIDISIPLRGLKAVEQLTKTHPDLDHKNVLLRAPHHKSATRKTTRRGFRGQRLLRFWELFQFILSTAVKREVYEPAYNDLLAAYLEARRYKTSGARRWIKLCFGIKTAWMVIDCIRVTMSSKLIKWALNFLHWGK